MWDGYQRGGSEIFRKRRSLKVGETDNSVIKLDIQEMEDRLVSLKESVELIRPYGETYLNKVVADLDGMNSDFVNEIQKVMSNMKDTNAPQLLSNLDIYASYVETILKTFQEVDNELSKKIAGEGETQP